METFDFFIPNGHMSLNLEEFFPAGASRIRKMVKIMKQDSRNNVPAILKVLKKELLLYKKDLEEHRKFCISKMFEWCGRKKTLTGYIDTKTFPSGDPIRSKKDLAEMKKRAKQAKDYEDEYRRDAKKAERTIKGIEKNLELLNELEE